MLYRNSGNQCRTEGLRATRRQNQDFLHNMVHRTTLSVSQLVLVLVRSGFSLLGYGVPCEVPKKRGAKPRETSKHWKMKASPSFETSGTDYFVTQRHTREERNTKPHSYEQLKTHNDRWRNNERKSSWRNLRTWLDKFWKKLRKVAKHLNQKGRPAFWPRFKHRPFDYT